MHRFVQRLKATQPVKVTTVLTFDPGEAAQVDFGAGPEIGDVDTGDVFKTWYFIMMLCWSRHQCTEPVPAINASRPD